VSGVIAGWENADLRPTPAPAAPWPRLSAA